MGTSLTAEDRRTIFAVIGEHYDRLQQELVYNQESLQEVEELSEVQEIWALLGKLQDLGWGTPPKKEE